MVSLEERSTYRNKLIRKPIVYAFVEFLENKRITKASFSQLDEVLFKLMQAFQSDDKSSFESEYAELSRREPSSSAPYIYNDFLAFVLICGTAKFNLNQDWMVKILNARNCSDDDCKLTTLTLRNLLGANYSSKDNHFPTIIVFQELSKMPLLGDEELNVSYAEIVQNSFPRFNSDFVNLLILRAFDIIILRKDILGKGEISRLRSFEKTFNKRVRLISRVFHWITVILVYGMLVVLYFASQPFQNFVKTDLALYGFLGGSGLITMFLFSKKIATFYESMIKELWGYKRNNYT